MLSQSNAPAQFKDFEHSGWELSAVQYDSSFIRLTSQTIPSLLKQVNLSVNEKFLDVATGPGPLAAAAKRITDNVVGIDFSESMLELARTRYPDIEFNSGDAEKLPYAANTFDVVGMNFGLLHLADPEKAIRESVRVLDTGGRFAFTVWAPPEEALGFQIVLGAIQKFGDSSVKLPPGPPFFLYSAPAESCAALERAGLVSPRWEKLELTWSLPTNSEFFDAFYMGTARTGGLLRAQSDTHLAAIRDEVITQVSARFGNTDGSVSVPMPAMLYIAEKL
jgi:SAM-dependent methyltransferase